MTILTLLLHPILLQGVIPPQAAAVAVGLAVVAGLQGAATEGGAEALGSGFCFFICQNDTASPHPASFEFHLRTLLGRKGSFAE